MLNSKLGIGIPRLLMRVAAVIVVLLAAGMDIGIRAQEDATKKEDTAKKEPTIVAGVLVDGKGSPIKDQSIELLMVGSEGKVVRFPMFGPETKTDAKGQFKLTIPETMMVPSGLELSGFTVGIVTGTKVKALSIAESGKVARIVLEPKTKKVSLGKIMLK
ncbi:MAG: hypothetical protein WBN92_10275 [Terriglobia bacterium]